jgi:predicted DNA-binding transcriptional regulator AlpA
MSGFKKFVRHPENTDAVHTTGKHKKETLVKSRKNKFGSAENVTATDKYSYTFSAEDFKFALPEKFHNRVVISKAEVCELAGISSSTADRWSEKGMLPPYVKFGGCQKHMVLKDVLKCLNDRVLKAYGGSSSTGPATSPDKVKEVEGPAHTIFLVSDLKNKCTEVSFTPSTTEGQSEDKRGDQS